MKNKTALPSKPVDKFVMRKNHLFLCHLQEPIFNMKRSILLSLSLIYLLVLSSVGSTIPQLLRVQEAIEEVTTEDRRNKRLDDDNMSYEDYPPSQVTLILITETIINADSTTARMYIDVKGALLTRNWLMTLKYDKIGPGWLVSGGTRVIPSNLDSVKHTVNECKYYSDKSPALCSFEPPFEEEDNKVAPVKLPMTETLSSTCDNFKFNAWSKSREMVMVPGYLTENKKCSNAISDFCLKLNPAFCGKGSGAPVYCGEEQIFMGVISFFWLAPGASEDDCPVTASVNNVTHYMTWIHDVTGRKVPFESDPSKYTTTTPTAEETDATNKVLDYSPNTESRRVEKKNSYTESNMNLKPDLMSKSTMLQIPYFAILITLSLQLFQFLIVL